MKGKSESEDGDDDRLNQMLCIEGYDGGDLRKRLADEVDRQQAPAKRQALEMRAKSEELSKEMLEHIARNKEAAIQRRMKKAPRALQSRVSKIAVWTGGPGQGYTKI